MNWITVHPEGVVINVKVVPRASRDQTAGVCGDAVKIRLRAPPVEGRANRALIEFLAGTLEIPKSAVELLRGHTGRRKLALLRGVDVETAARLIVG